MDVHKTRRRTGRTYPSPLPSPITSDRIKALAARAMEGAPALTAGEMRELAEAILEHQGLSGEPAAN